MTAKYLIRFDDICPTMNWEIWQEVEKSLLEFGGKPILSVIPSNCHEALKVAAPRENFWERVREWQARGWTIGMHG